MGADGLSRAFLAITIITIITCSWIPLIWKELKHLKSIDEFSKVGL